MKNHRLQQKNTAHARKVWLLAALLAGALAMTGCYMEPDRIVDDNNGLTVATGGQQFDTVITPTPNVTATPEPTAPTATDNQQVDWSSWDFGNDTATNPPSNVINIGDNTATSNVTVGLSTPTPTPAMTASTSSTLRTGASGAAVKQLQQRLKELGYYTGSVDGSYGAGTASAVKDFQAANNLGADGVAGSKTQEAMYSYYAVAKKNSSTGSSSGSNSSSSGSSSSGSTSTSQYTNGKTDIYLKLGSSGSQVKILQNRLIVLGYLSGSADGDFAETTEAAVVAFQKRNSIYADGIAGPTTLTKLYSSSARKASAVVANIGSLKLGMTGGGVRALQTRLKELGFYTGSVDGDYGAGTQTAVTAFQQANGLTADGVAGKATLNALYGGTGTGGSSTGSGTKPETFGETASIGGYSSLTPSKGSVANVTALQSALSSKGYYVGDLDGDFGTVTSDAVKNYQAALGLRVTGTAGPATQRILYGGAGSSGSYSKLQIGSSGTAVRNLQYTLYELKYYDGNITGTFDEATANAVTLFQQVNGLAIDGVAGVQTQSILYSSAAKPNNL
ncbi:MAG: peptidoglycan-binding protein [Candidatus Limiplasma sp.]|nr:peptidoglycan-binding protein [Candidatus Limiplasma sp.]MEA5144981.1 peptidoglycan-binding protein [Candidatus Limiplasma sp.]